MHSTCSATYTRQEPDGFYSIQVQNHERYLLLPPPTIPVLNGYESRSLNHSNELSIQERTDAKARAASKSHSEAERRRRVRINNHLAHLRTLLPNTTKTDKASLLGEVIQHLKELNHQTSLLAETTNNVPTETDELTVDDASHGDGRLLIKTSMCCEDRTNIIPDLIKTLKALRLRTLRAEIVTVGGRIKYVLFVTDENQPNCGVGRQQHCINSIQEAFKRVLEKCNGDEYGSGNAKRQRITNN